MRSHNFDAEHLSLRYPEALADLRCLTVRQPWGWAIVHHVGKDVENRTFGTTPRWLGIHAGKGEDRLIPGRSTQEAMLALGMATAKEVRYDASTTPPSYREAASPACLRALHARGAIIGLVRVADSHHAEPGCCDSPWAERASGYSWHWCIERPVAIDPPLPARGALGLWRPDSDLRAELGLVLEQMAAG